MSATRSRHVGLLFAAVAAFTLIGTGQLFAQRFQTVYGSPACADAGRSGVAQLAAGGYVIVGESYANGAGCGPSHILVEYTGINGAPVWSNIYSIGSSDSALDVVECSNGDLAICGVTQNVPTCNGPRDAFVLRLNAAGGVVAVRTVGSPSLDEIGWNIVEARTGDGINAFPGDLIVAGYTTWNAGTGGAGPWARDGFIFRTNAALTVVRWAMQYGGPNSHDDYLYGVDECRVGVTSTQTGDIVATGGTNTWGAGGYDIWMLRVDGNTGLINAAPQGAATYGDIYDEEGRAIVELQNLSTGNLVVAGLSNSRPFPSTNYEVAMVQTANYPCTFIADQYAGDNGTRADGGFDLKEDAFPNIPTANDVVVTGYTSLGAPLVGPNVFLQKFTVGTMAPVGGAMAYGGSGIDWGWSVNNCLRATAPETQGYVIAGFTQSANLIGAANPQDMYVIKTNQTFGSGCNERPFTFSAQPAQFLQSCTPPSILNIPWTCVPLTVGVTLIPTTWFNTLCYNSPAAHERGDGGNDGISGVEAPTAVTFTEGRMTAYPNPLPKGMPINLRFDLVKETSAQMAITDMAGHEVYRGSTTVKAGSQVVPVATAGWARGTYLVRVTIGGTSQIARIVLAD
ncbi:MAG: T9SS type A sorting domain-containing protein [Bacteroidetes bacterium]|nr:T9SS type A sorting domain-containing protein [Bacteroidota bacterium]